MQFLTRSLLATILVTVVVIGALPLSTVTAAESTPSLQLGVGQQLAQPIVIVNTSFLNLRSGPGGMYSIVGVVPGATELPVIGRNLDASWWQVQSAYGTGWVSAEFVIPRGDFSPVPVVQSSGVLAQPHGAVIGQTAYVYMYPDRAASLLGLALDGSTLLITGKTGDGVWWQVETNAGLGWVMQDEVFLRGDATYVPVVTAESGMPVTAAQGSAGAASTFNISGERPIALVYSDSLSVKASADYDAEAIDSLSRGDRVEILDYSVDREFALILFKVDRLGWIIVSEVAISDPTDWRTQVWFDGPAVLDLKAQPTFDSATLAMVPANERLVVVNEADGGWYQVAHSMGTGWVPAVSVEIIRNGPPTQPGGATSALAQGQSGGGSVLQQPGTGIAPAAPAPIRTYIIVNTSYLNIRSGPGANYTSVQQVSGGTELDIVASTPDRIWFQVTGAFGAGWVNSEFVIFRGDFSTVSVVTYDQALGAATIPEVIVGGPVNVYLGVGVETGLLGTAPSGLTMPVIGRTGDGNWLQVQTSSGAGWVLSSTVTFRGNYAQVPIVG